jgi:uncharacterized repeat protein (TIGR01451 family)
MVPPAIAAVAPPADLAIQVTASPDPVVTGPHHELTYKITLTNQGPGRAFGITVVDTLPNTVVVRSCTPSNGSVCEGLGSNRTVNFTSLDANQSATITIIAEVDCSVLDKTKISNAVSVGSISRDLDQSNNQAIVIVTASNPPPEINGVKVDKPILFHADGKMKEVKVSYNATDNCAVAECRLEVGYLPHPLSTTVIPVPKGDAEIVDDHTVFLRAKSNGDCARYYVITVRCRDNVGAVSTKRVLVKVPD